MTNRYWDLLLVIAIAAAAFLFDANTDFVGWNDLVHARHSASFALALEWSREDLQLPVALGKLAELAYSLIFYPHGTLPPLYIGLLYRAIELAGVPFTPFLFQLPTALLGIATVGLFHHMLRAAGVRRLLAFIAALALIGSPIFLGSARGIATYWVVAIVFNQALGGAALMALDSSPSRRARIFVGLAFLHIVLSDVLSFLQIGALVAAYGLRGEALAALATADGIKRIWRNLLPLMRPWVLVPPLMALCVLATAAAASLLARGDLAGLPLYPPLLFWAFAAHGSAVGTAQSLDLQVWLERLPHLFGDGWPILFAGGIALAIAGRGNADHSFAWRFSWIATLGFAALFFCLVHDHPAILYFDQIYVVLPAILLLALCAQRACMRSLVLSRAAVGVLAVFAVAAAAGASAFIWRVPIAFSASRLIVAENNGLSGDVIGIRRPEYGYQAAGFLMRLAIAESLRRNPDAMLDLAQVSNVGIKGYDVTLMYAGLYQKGDWFAGRTGKRPKMIRSQVLANPIRSNDSPCGMAEKCEAVWPLESDAATYRPAGSSWLPACPANNCDGLRAGDGEVQRYDLYDGPELRHVVWMQGAALSEYPPGRYEIARLRRDFTGRFPRIADYFPPRPIDRLRAISARLLPFLKM